jgi:hypothetical protein
MNTTLHFTSLTSLQEHLRGGTLVRLLKTGLTTELVFIPAGQPATSCRLVRIETVILSPPDSTEEQVLDEASSEPTEFSEWF